MIYLDHAATTGIRPEVFEAMKPFLCEAYGNPSSAYEHAYTARDAVRRARKEVASLIQTDPESIYFTSGGTEADNWALRGVLQLPDRGRHLITSAIEHHAILHTADYLEKLGFEVTRLPVDEEGLVSPRRLKAAIRPDTALISIMFANNEIGTIQPIRELAAIAREHGILFHTDAVQAFGQVPISVEELGIDLLSASSHKLYGPKGVGCLYVRKGLELPPLLLGGGQENGRRAGTENVPGIAGFGCAARLAGEEMAKTTQGETALRDYLIDQVARRIPFSRLNGSRTSRLPGNANFSFQFIEGGALLAMLDMKGICASAGSACSASSSAPSHVLKAIGLPDSLIRGSLRFSLGRETTREEIDLTLDALDDIISHLRELSEDYIRLRRRAPQTNPPRAYPHANRQPR